MPWQDLHLCFRAESLKLLSKLFPTKPANVVGHDRGNDALTLPNSLVFMVWSFGAEMISVTFYKVKGVGVSNLATEQYAEAGTGVIPEESAFFPSLVKILYKNKTPYITSDSCPSSADFSCYSTYTNAWIFKIDSGGIFHLFLHKRILYIKGSVTEMHCYLYFTSSS